MVIIIFIIIIIREIITGIPLNVSGIKCTTILSLILIVYSKLTKDF